MPMWPWNQWKVSRISQAKYAVFRRFHLNSVWELLSSGFHSYHDKPKKEWKMDSISRLCVCVQAQHRLSRGSVMQSWLYMMFAKVLGKYWNQKVHKCVALFKIVVNDSRVLTINWSILRRPVLQNTELTNINRLGTNTACSLHQHIYVHYTYLTER